MTILANPQNPYASFLVQASAGSGKTYQLSHRFFSLVMAGVTPSTIVCITFTKPTAADMHAKILRLAHEVLTTPSLRAHFNQQIEEFYQQALGSEAYSAGFILPKPIDAAVAANKILDASQAIRISTIDSLFSEWVRKFPFEASDQEQAGGNSFDLAPASDLRRLKNQAQQQALLRAMDEHRDNPWLQQRLQQTGPRGLSYPFELLQTNESLLWLLQQNGGGLTHHPLNATLEECYALSEEQFITQIEPYVRTIAAAATDLMRDNVLAALSDRTLSSLLASKLFNQDIEVSGTLRGKRREGVADEIRSLEQQVRMRLNAQRLALSNAASDFFATAQAHFAAELAALKNEERYAEFSDLSRGAYRLFNDPDNLGAAQLIQRNIQHIMLDEFQDTNRVQWSVFRQICIELLSGGGQFDEVPLLPTVFIVGDSKQSIYGFREADPSIIDEALAELGPMGLNQFSMNKSYRAAPTLFAFLNQWFPQLMPEFPEHATATNDAGIPVIPDQSRIMLVEPFGAKAHDFAASEDATEGTDCPEAEQEATFIAATLRRILHDEPHLYPVWDNGRFRPIQSDDCAVLYRASTYAGVYERALRNAGLHAAREETRGYLQRVEITDSIALMRYLALPNDLLHLSTVLRSPFGNISDKYLVELIDAAHQQRQNERPCTIVLRLLRGTHPQLCDTLLNLQAAAGKDLPHAVLLKAFVHLNAYAHYRQHLDEVEGELAVANLIQLVELCRRFEDSGALTFLQIIEQLHKLSEDDILGNAAVHRRCIKLMTAHKSKGLEFPLVVLADATAPGYRLDSYWARVTKGDHAGLYYIGSSGEQPVDNLEFAQLKLHAEDEQRQEAARQLYVALTRAKQYLIATGTQGRDRNQGRPSFLHRMLDAARDAGASAEVMHGQTTLILNSPTATAAAAHQTDAVSKSAPSWQPSADRQQLMPAQILTVRPHKTLTTKESYPRPDTGSAPLASTNNERHLDPRLYGIVLHRALELSFVGLELTANDLQRLLSKQSPALTADAAREYLTTALAEARALQQSPAWQAMLENHERVMTEAPIVHLDAANLLSGQIDLLIFYKDGTCRIVDYKTAAGVQSLRGASAEHLLSWCRQSGYDQQLAAYATAVEAASGLSSAAIKRSVFLTEIAALVDL